MLFIFTFMGFNALSTPLEIYYGKKGLWYVYLDLRKEIKVVEIGGIKYGYLDVLNHVGQNDTIASSEIGVLLLENGNYCYRNKNLNLSVKLQKYNYTEQIDYKRRKLFDIDADTKISALEKSFENTNYKMNSSEMYADYIYFRDNIKMEEDYLPSSLLRFYTEIIRCNLYRKDSCRRLTTPYLKTF